MILLDYCTGKKSMKLFEEAFGENYIKMSTGKIIKITKDGLE